MALVLLLGSATACGSLPETGPTAGSLEDALRYTPERADLLRAARDSLVARCMRDRGFRWTAPPRDAILTASPHGVYDLETPQATRAYR